MKYTTDRLNLCLSIISNKPNMREGYSKQLAAQLDFYSKAYNHLLSSLEYHKPAKCMLVFGKANLRNKTKLSHKQRITWLKNYIAKYDVKFYASRHNDKFLKWSTFVTFATSAKGRRFENVGQRIAYVLSRKRNAA